jgi:hypothetical protein
MSMKLKILLMAVGAILVIGMMKMWYPAYREKKLFEQVRS